MNKLEGTNIFIAQEDLKGFDTLQEVEKGHWEIARPVGYIGFWHTLDCAMKVLRHEADIVVWKVWK
jgi:hypothetical protein